MNSFRKEENPIPPEDITDSPEWSSPLYEFWTRKSKLQSRELDLVELRARVLSGISESSQLDEVQREVIADQSDIPLFVSHDGFIRIGEPSERGIRGESRIPMSIFTTEYAAIESDREFVRTRMPSDTQELNVRGTIGWNYTFSCSLGQSYSMFVYFDGRYYQVKCVHPELEYQAESWSPADPRRHTFPDGRLCLESSTRGCLNIEFAYTTSVLWATGFSVYKLTGQFPFTDF